MVEVAVAGSLKPVAGGAGRDDVGDVADGAAVFDAKWTWSGESGSLGGVGMAWTGGTPSHGCAGVQGDWQLEVAGVVARVG